MVDFTKLMALSESANGFNGGSFVDEMPNYTLDEAVCYLPMMIMESQIEQYDMTAAQNEAIVEAVVSSVQTGDNSAFESINEGAIKGLIEKAKALFDKIIKGLTAIIAKIKAFIIARKSKSKEFYEKYAAKVDEAKCKDLTYTGYTFKKDIKVDADVAGIIKSVYGDQYANFDANKTPESVDELTDDHAGRMRQVASEATGIELKQQDWSNELTGILYDDNKKTEMKYGTECFSLAAVQKTLVDIKPVEELQKKYEGMLTSVKGELNRIGTFQESEKNEEGNTRYKYLNNYLTAYQEVYNALSMVNATAKKYYDAKWSQATKMLMTMASLGKKVEEKSAKKEEAPADNKPEAKKEEK